MQMHKSALSVLLAMSLGACVSTSGEVGRGASQKPLSLSVESFSSLPGWRGDKFRDFAAAYQKSCTPLLKRSSQNRFGQKEIFGKNQEWQIACRKFSKINKTNSNEVRKFFEENFVPYAARSGSNPNGLFTGYYEAALNGSLTRKGKYQYPLHARPSDLVMVQLGDFREELKGQRIAGRVKGGSLKPYETHAEITAGKLPNSQEKVLVWVDSPVDAFFIQIQGSGAVQLDSGRLMRVGYAGQNGHPYYAIGRELVKRGALEKRDVSMQSIRAWLEENPDQAQEVMQTNKSYVFFKKLDGSAPVGGQGVELTPMRSLAIDRSIIPYGMPVWVDLDAPTASSQPIQRLMVTQDTGGAIRGPVRGDFFWGYGKKAEEMAGNMKSDGRYWFLLPK
ncbi:MAG: MltA domain-containing protein [Alphaproteobacteria bacterium]|nr:MltA domain-containing protein [Alphaproteobacteria bacterium]